VAPHLPVLLSVLGLIGWSVAGCAPVLAAPPHLIAAWPADGASLPARLDSLELTFNHRLDPELSWVTVSREDDGTLAPIVASVEPMQPRRLSVRVVYPSIGRYRLHWHAVATGTLAARDGEQAFSVQLEATAPPHVEVSEVRVEAGDTLEVTGSGFGLQCHVHLSIGDDQQVLADINTDNEGSFTDEARIPATVAFGEQPVSATDSCGSSATAAVLVRWGGWPPLVAFDVGQPGPRSSEVTFSVTLRNRSDYLLERVRVILADPEGATFIRAEASPVRQQQSLVWEMPTLDRGVVGPFVATYRVPGTVVSHARIEFRHRRSPVCTGDECLPAFVSETTSESTPVSPAT
jgi:methionine-rich copper-binding protein CopC